MLLQCICCTKELWPSLTALSRILCVKLIFRTVAWWAHFSPGSDIKGNFPDMLVLWVKVVWVKVGGIWGPVCGEITFFSDKTPPCTLYIFLTAAWWAHFRTGSDIKGNFPVIWATFTWHWSEWLRIYSPRGYFSPGSDTKGNFSKSRHWNSLHLTLVSEWLRIQSIFHLKSIRIQVHVWSSWCLSANS